MIPCRVYMQRPARKLSSKSRTESEAKNQPPGWLELGISHLPARMVVQICCSLTSNSPYSYYVQKHVGTGIRHATITSNLISRSLFSPRCLCKWSATMSMYRLCCTAHHPQDGTGASSETPQHIAAFCCQIEEFLFHEMLTNSVYHLSRLLLRSTL